MFNSKTYSKSFKGDRIVKYLKKFVFKGEDSMILYPQFHQWISKEVFLCYTWKHFEIWVKTKLD